jgi:carbon-monoxide dehydrogenase large subunit
MVIASTCPLGLKVERFASMLECVVTNKCPAGAYRGFGNPVRVLAVERCLDLLAARLGLDPAEVRRRNLLHREDLPYRAVTGARIESGTLVEAMEQALAMAGYERRREEQRAARAAERWIGIGIAAFAEGTAPSFEALAGRFGGWDSCRLRVDPDGRVSAAVGVTTQGQGHETTIAQVVADALGVAPDDVVVTHGDTAATPFGLGSWGSRGALVATGATLEAARQVREKIALVAAHVLEASPADIRIDDGRVSVAGGGGRTLTLAEVARAAWTGRTRLPAAAEPGLETTAYVEPPAIEARPDAQGRAMRYGAVANAAHVAVVEVDAATGIVRILDYVVVHDCGTIINPAIVDGQIRGGVAQGIGGVLHERIVYDADGQLLTGTLMDYHLPKASEIPPVRIAHLESPDPAVAGGVKGVGEGGTIGATAAIANAVADALAPLGVRVTGTPLTAPAVWRLIMDARGDH